MTRLLPWLSAFWLALGPVAGPAAADEPAPAPEAAAEEIDFHAAYRRMRRAMRTLEPEPTPETAPTMARFEALREAWRLGVKPRIRKVLRRIERLDREKDWVVVEREDGIVASGLDPEAWSGFVRDASWLYTRLGAMQERYLEAEVTWQQFEKVFLPQYYQPTSPRPPPSREALNEVESNIRTLIARGQTVPWSLYASRDRLAERVAEEVQAERERVRRENAHRLRVAMPKLKARWAMFQEKVAGLRRAIAASMADLRTLVAQAQAAEEKRLASLAAQVEGDERYGSEVEERLAEMREGRRKAERFRDERSARYGRLLRQGWMVHRHKLLQAVERAGDG